MSDSNTRKVRPTPLASPIWYPSNIDPNYIRASNTIMSLFMRIKDALSENTQAYHAMMQQHGNKAHNSSWWQQCNANYCRKHAALWKNAGEFEPTAKQKRFLQRNANRMMAKRAAELTRLLDERNKEQLEAIMDAMR